MLMTLFHMSRIAGYAVQGALLAAAGGVLTLAVPHAEQVARLAAAAVMLALAMRILWNRDVLRIESMGGRIFRAMSRLFRPLSRYPAAARSVATGVLWGFLPCGLSYSMMLVATARGRPLIAAATMMLFGLATIPGLVSISLGARRLLATEHVRAVTGVAVIGGAVWTAVGAVLPHAHWH
jgi:sulfite exporter TauE/SafE